MAENKIDMDIVEALGSAAAIQRFRAVADVTGWPPGAIAMLDHAKEQADLTTDVCRKLVIAQKQIEGIGKGSN